ncbi:MAG: SUMF1/EgtB/PvdO family nonheme iron enzyme [Gemmataceae bacterium]
MRTSSLAASVVLLLTGAVLAQPPGGKKYALLVGVNRYDDPAFRSLEFAVNDVTATAALLKAQGYSVVLLTEAEGKRNSGRMPTGANVRARVAELLKGTAKGDLVLIGLAGHGLQFDDTDDAFFCPRDARPDPTRTDTLISLATLYRQLNDDSRADAKLLLVDACRNDPLASRSAGVEATKLPRPPRNVSALFSCKAGERAYETETHKHGVFFKHVLDGLAGKAADSDDEVTWAGLVNYVSKRVPADPAIKGVGRKQTPTLNAGEFFATAVLTKSWKSLRPTLLESPFPPDRAREVRELWAQLRGVSEEGVAPTGIRLLLIPPGSFTAGGDESPEAVVRGFPAEDVEVFANEHPAARATIANPFYVGATEVTVAQFRTFVQAKGYVTDGEAGRSTKNPTGAASDADKNTWNKPGFSKWSEDCPVTHVSWNDAQAFVRWLNEVEKTPGRKYRLPTQLEWEYVARAGTTTRYWTGNDPERLATAANVPDKTLSLAELGRKRDARYYTDTHAFSYFEGAKDGHDVWKLATCVLGEEITLEQTFGAKPETREARRTVGDLSAGEVRVVNASAQNALYVRSGTTPVKIEPRRSATIRPTGIGASHAIRGSDGYAEVAPVASFRPNPFGLHDVHGNVWEWCEDPFVAGGPAALVAGTGRPTGQYVIRGGCFL